MKERRLLPAVMAGALVLILAVPAFADHGRTESQSYNSPAVGQGDIFGVCLRGDPPLDSCVEVDPLPGETHVKVQIEDDLGNPVYGTVGQVFQGTWLWDENFCGESSVNPIQDEILGEPIPVIVFPWATPGLGDDLTTPCLPGEGAGATSGTVFFTF